MNCRAFITCARWVLCIFMCFLFSFLSFSMSCVNYITKYPQRVGLLELQRKWLNASPPQRRILLVIESFFLKWKIFHCFKFVLLQLENHGFRLEKFLVDVSLDRKIYLWTFWAQENNFIITQVSFMKMSGECLKKLFFIVDFCNPDID